MSHHRIRGWAWISGCVLLAFGLLAAWSQPVRAEDTPAAGDDVASLAARIDAIIQKRWLAEQAVAAPPVDDAAFMRRVHLDIAGKIPAVADLHEFLDDKDPDKRRKLVDRLLESPGYILNFSNVWRSVMMPEAEADLQIRVLVPTFENWLRKRLTENASYDSIVREILTVPVDPRNATNPRAGQGELTPVSFYQAKELKPENLAAGTARIFLGVRIECAQCHDHPFDDWKREQFWGYAAFFAGLQRDNDQVGALNSIRELFDRRELIIPGTGDSVRPTLLDGTPPKLKFRESARGTLASWMASADNPYFTKTAANRMWGRFFGVGIVNPVDDFTANNPPSHPELLDLLAREFAAHKFDVKFLIRAITASKTYQLSSRQTHPSQEDPRLFARMPLKGLSPEQLFDSIAQATGYFEPFAGRDPLGGMQNNTPRVEFLQMFDNGRDAVTEQQTTILQALAMMNGQFVTDATSLEKSATLAAIADFPEMTTAERIEALYLAALSRPPRSDELERLVPYVDKGGAAKDPKKALGDLFWALLNSSEFLLNR